MVLNYFRSKELQQYYQDLHKIYQSPSNDQLLKEIDQLQETQIPLTQNPVLIESHVLNDSQLESWVSSMPTMDGTRRFIWNQMKYPSFNVNELILRQKCIHDYKPNQTEQWSALSNVEKDILWSFQLPPLEKAWPLPLLFPQWFPVRWVNHTPRLLELYHLYRIYGAPLSHFIYPLTLLLGPWWYVRTKLKWNLTWPAYIKFLKTILVELIRFRSGNIKELVYKIVTLVVYVGLYIYGVIQSFDIAHMLYTVRKQLYTKLEQIHTFLKVSKKIWDENPKICENIMTLWKLPTQRVHISLSTSIQGIYSLYKNTTLQKNLKQLLTQMYVIEAVHTMSSYQKEHSKTVSFPSWTPSEPTKLYAMGHPCLPPQQQRNPVLLNKNLIITGPNAAGKTTYVRSILANYILAQTFGLCFAKKSWIKPVATMASFMRVQDVIGSMSLYEAECRRCKELIHKALNSHDPILFFLDEPMHATPPIEGASTAMALAKYLGKLPHVNLILTTHYHVLTRLEVLEPKHFHNISMEASLSASDIQFSYRIQSGPSYQSIAIEMLEKDAFPKEMLHDAIEFKNKICRVENK